MNAGHWETAYATRRSDSAGWFEPDPIVSRRLVTDAVARGARSVIDIGGGASTLVDHLLDAGLDRVAVLDVSTTGIGIARSRLADRADRVEWICADVTRAADLGRFDVWHDRALFHFLTDEEDRRSYLRLAEATVPIGGTVIIATFAGDGPERCSGLPVRRYEPEQLAAECGPGFELTGTVRHVHLTPGGAEQRYQYSTFRRSAVGTAGGRTA